MPIIIAEVRNYLFWNKKKFDNAFPNTEERKMSEINFSQFSQFNFNNLGSFSPIQQQGDVNNILSDLFQSLSSLFEGLGSGQFNPGSGSFPSCGCTSPPIIDDSSHPSGNLQTKDGVITTPGGYQIEPMSQFEWKITGPDGKSTRIWGDPHVAESDGGKWDFKRDSTFMLPDGTKINVTTAPWKNGTMTVTSGLEIINGNDRVLVSDIDKGKGNIGPVTADGFAHANSFGNKDVFVMGNETDDWSYTGKEIIGSNSGGESFKLGDDLAPGISNRPNSGSDIMDMFMKFITNMFGGNSMVKPSDIGLGSGLDQSWGNIFGNNQTTTQPPLSNQPNRPFPANYRPPLNDQQNMQNIFRALANMFDTLSRLSSMNETMQLNRNRAIYV